MRRRSRRAAGLASIVFAIGAITSSLAWANGQEFFDPGADAKVDLVYVGRVRDVNGRFLKGAEVVIWSPDAGMTFPAVTDAIPAITGPGEASATQELRPADVTQELRQPDAARKPRRTNAG